MIISIIIINYNTTDYLKTCLNSVLKETKDIEYEIIVVDNNSTDRTIEKYPEKYQSVKFHFRNINNGFGAGCDYGAKNSSGKYLYFLNPDIILKNNCLSDFYDFMENHSEFGVCSGILTDSNNNPIYTFNKFPGIYWEVTEALLGNGESKVDKILEKLKQDKSGLPFEVDWLIGASMFMRRDVYEQAGGFDNDLFLYCEDTDLQLRIRKLGYKIVCIPSIKIEHFTKSSVRIDEVENLYHFYLHKSKLIYMKKHFNFLKRYIIILSYILGFIFRAVLLPFRKKFCNNKKEKFNQLVTLLKFYIIPGSSSKYHIHNT